MLRHESFFDLTCYFVWGRKFIFHTVEITQTFEMLWRDAVQIFGPTEVWLIDWLATGFEPFRSRCTQALNNFPFVPHINSREPCCFTKISDGPQTYILNILWPQEEGAQIHMSELNPKLHTHTVCGLRFHPLLHTSYIRDYWLAPLSGDVFSGYYVQ